MQLGAVHSLVDNGTAAEPPTKLALLYLNCTAVTDCIAFGLFRPGFDGYVPTLRLARVLGSGIPVGEFREYRVFQTPHGDCDSKLKNLGGCFLDSGLACSE
jgi:hypothetical protein